MYTKSNQDALKCEYNGTCEIDKTAATHLKEKFPNIKIGGYGSCGFYSIYEEDADDLNRTFNTYLYDFLTMIKEENIPFDFFSWHTYSDSLEKFTSYMKFARETLEKYGFANIEIHCNEWNVGGEGNGYHLMRNMIGASYIACAMCIMQNTNYVDKAAYYVFSSAASYNGFFDLNTRHKTCTYYAFKAFGKCHKLKNQVFVENNSSDLQAIAASNGKECSVLISNYNGENTEASIKLNNIPENCQVFVDYISESCEPKTQVYNSNGSDLEITLNIAKNNVVTINILPASTENYSSYLDY